MLVVRRLHLNCSKAAAQAHCVREQAANYGDFRQRMLWGAEEAIRSAGAQLAVPTALYYQETPPPPPPAPTAERAA
jgi:hypothetical protein